MASVRGPPVLLLSGETSSALARPVLGDQAVESPGKEQLATGRDDGARVTSSAKDEASSGSGGPGAPMRYGGELPACPRSHPASSCAPLRLAAAAAVSSS